MVCVFFYRRNKINYIKKRRLLNMFFVVLVVAWLCFVMSFFGHVYSFRLFKCMHTHMDSLRIQLWNLLIWLHYAINANNFHQMNFRRNKQWYQIVQCASFSSFCSRTGAFEIDIEIQINAPQIVFFQLVIFQFDVYKCVLNCVYSTKKNTSEQKRKELNMWCMLIFFIFSN